MALIKERPNSVSTHSKHNAHPCGREKPQSIPLPSLLCILAAASFVLASELWEEHFESLLALVKEYIIDIWKERKSRLYGDYACAHKPRPWFSTRELRDIAVQNGKRLCQGAKPGTGTLMYVYVAPPTLVGAWSMALWLRRCIEYFTEALFTSVCICVCLLTHSSDDHQT